MNDQLNFEINSRGKRIGTGKYKYVIIYRNKQGVLIYQAAIPIFNWSKHFLNERQAAKAVDLKFIEHNQEPVNILKRRK